MSSTWFMFGLLVALIAIGFGLIIWSHYRDADSIDRETRWQPPPDGL